MADRGNIREFTGNVPRSKMMKSTKPFATVTLAEGYRVNITYAVSGSHLSVCIAGMFPILSRDSRKTIVNQSFINYYVLIITMPISGYYITDNDGNERNVVQEFIEMRERLSELEHVQWSQIKSTTLNNLTNRNIRRWNRQIETPYSELSESEKDRDRDREQADKAIAIFETFMFQCGLIRD